jgi:hypothetical protein
MAFAFVLVYTVSLGMESCGLIGSFAVMMAFLSLVGMDLTPNLGREIAHSIG